MIYTLGLKVNYEKYLNEYSLLQKLGKTDEYEGGTVWKTKEEAQLNCPDGYKVYGVLADWETQTEKSKTSETGHDLLVTSLLVRL